MSNLFDAEQELSDATRKLNLLQTIPSTPSSSLHEDEDLPRSKDPNTRSLADFLDTERTLFQPTKESDMIKSLIMSNENPMEKSSLFRSLIEHTEPTANAQQLTEHFSAPESEQKKHSSQFFDEHLLRPFSECVEQYYRILYRVCECTEELKQELRQVKSERDQLSEDLITAENAYADVKKRNEKLKLIINEHKMVRQRIFAFFNDTLFTKFDFLFSEHRNIETFLGRISSLYRRTKTEICCPQATCTREIE